MQRHGRRTARMRPALTAGLALATAALAAAAPASAQLGIEVDGVDVSELAGAANGNGVPEPGEGVALSARLLSAEFTPLTDLVGTLAAVDPADATVDRSATAWPQVDFGTPTASTEPFRMAIGSGVPCGSPVRLSLTVTSSAGSATVPVAIATGAAAAGTAPQASDDPAVVIPDGAGSAEQSVTLTAPGTVKSLQVSVVGLSHPYAGDLRLSLVAPDGRTVVLADRRGGATPDAFAQTVFSDAGSRDVRYAAAPFTGEVRPEEPISRFDGTPAAGVWRLRIEDRSVGGSGVLDGWALTAPAALCAPLGGDPSTGGDGDASSGDRPGRRRGHGRGRGHGYGNTKEHGKGHAHGRAHPHTPRGRAEEGGKAAGGR